MRLALTSDLHVEHHPEVVPLIAERVRALAPDVLIVAGDVSSKLDTLEATLAALRGAAPELVFVAGNHDLWTLPGAPSSRARYEREIPAACARAGAHAIGSTPIEIGGVVFCGVTGWYDYSLRNRDLDATFTRADYERGAWGRLRWNDTARVVWPDDDGHELAAPAICAAQVAALEAQLADAGTRPTVVVTHHLPFAGLVTSKGEPPWDFINGFMGSDRLGEAIRGAANVRAAVCGHTHFRKRLDVDGRGGRFSAETSPIGYPREYARMAGLTLAERVADRTTAIDLR
ncbi:MAG TPA: metallophosphoesterase [Polyangia bacterium]|jgi:3',5'-cyclic AMP phosphodiesterase CpdA